MDNIILIGMPGAGKSTIGVLLAKTINYRFIDTDLIIQRKYGKLLKDIIAERGIDEFLLIEERETISLNNADQSVIATGGSIVLKEKAMVHLKRIGTVVYLKLPYDELEKRVKNITTRGIVMKKDQTFYDVYRERTPLYEKYAEITICCSGKTMEQIVELLAEKIF
ncbi:MAG: shikimate kinase [Bacillota bacterium]|jgi:shikimate kinase|nr:shikimate kinase [Bacillota bacterium]NLV63085.1 shikimate kinase [Clostridiaceae bacterium]